MNAWTSITEPSNRWSGFSTASIELENGSGIFLLENGGRVLLEVQTATAWQPFPRYVALTSEDGRVLTDDSGNVILIAREPLTVWTPIGD